MVSPMRTRPAILAPALLGLVVAGAGCGAGERNETTSTPPPPRAADFPPAAGPELAALTRAAGARPQLRVSVSVIRPGTNRFAFALFDAEGRQLQAPAAVYLGSPAGTDVRGPFVARLESLAVQPRFLSRTAAQDPGDPSSIYVADLPVPRRGRFVALAVTRVGGRLVSSTAAPVASGGPQPLAVGARAPRIHTPTVAGVSGDVQSIETRVPPDDMHRTDFAAVVGRKPVVVAFATPQLCQNRLCAPVVDAVAQVQAEFGDRAEFIHMEVYRDNDIRKGVRPQLSAFGLRTEPWVYAIDRRGRVAARLEGAASVDELRQAVRRALG
jgi:hypothetical protein